MRKLLILLLALLSSILETGSNAQSLSSAFYDIGTPSVVEYYVDPSGGSDSNSGNSISSPRRTVSSIWNSLPQNSALATGVRINLLPGTYGSDHLPNYWENRVGTAAAPIILSAAQGYGTVFFSRDINMVGTSYFYLLGIDIKNKTTGGYGDAFHAERCDHVLLRGNSFNGAPSGLAAGGDVAHETIKFNQSRDIYIENNNIQGAEDNGIDFVAVFGGQVRGNRIHDTQGWCLYAKGGSSYLLVESNMVYQCGEGGITAGQGTGFEFMEAPYLRFEANYIKIVNNIIHDVVGAALGVNGGYNILVDHNTSYKVGTRSHLLEVVFGERSCDGDTSACRSRRDAGGWGPTTTGSDSNQPIGNRNVIVTNNVFYNPAGTVSGSQHFAVYGPRTPTAAGIPSPQLADSGVVIKGNIIWNGTSTKPVGIEESDQGCQPSNASCNLNQLIADNSINTTEPDFILAANNDFRPVASGALSQVSSVAVVDFSPLETIAGGIPEGDTLNQSLREFSGASVSARPPGAISSSTSSIDLPSSGTENGTVPTVPGSGGSGDSPKLAITKASAKKSSGKITLQVLITASDSDGISTVSAAVIYNKKTIGTYQFKKVATKYSLKKSIKLKANKITIKVVASDLAGQTTTKSKSVKVT